ncbi:MAG: FtsB family cell division protein, partial [Gemmatimonadaceae bacterium]
KRIIWWALILGALFFAVQGGEYSSRDLYVLHRRSSTLTRDVDSLQRQVDSLGRFLKLVKSDSATQERIAREEFGMVRGDKEILYRFGESSSENNRK